MLVQVQLAATLYEDFNTKSKTESSPERLLLVSLGAERRISGGFETMDKDSLIHLGKSYLG